MTMNMKEGSYCVVNYGEDLTVVDFNGDSASTPSAIVGAAKSAGNDEILLSAVLSVTAALHKLCVYCPGLLRDGVLLENSDFGLERDIGSHRFIHLFQFSPDSPRLSRSTFCNYFKGDCTRPAFFDLLGCGIFNTDGHRWSLLGNDIPNSTGPLYWSPTGTIEVRGPSLCFSHGVATVCRPVISASSAPSTQASPASSAAFPCLAVVA
ncbi:hypothetical protein GW17_00055641 [Ensete ventricosum]|nr:hypothetical protein GW17_00055641 [Ensete ventricosum]